MRLTHPQKLDHEHYGHCAFWNSEQACIYCLENPPASWAQNDVPRETLDRRRGKHPRTSGHQSDPQL